MKQVLKKEVLANIELKRKEMIVFAQKVGYTNERTVKCSQDLDMYLNKYQLILLNRMS
ncbi:aspartyl-phosphate phosphatase Spo0E family protein [Bacillus salipaludis]|uniref:aspartyl-phosphate phosphatase Spo0E family protein n=1 Tax=Bacillus salipaludis TaxID=2547811 RepID=UPI002E21B937|nr:aspartyl-phosphate phosphatase Spo0E family protein [Bacillus salipaludis]